MKFIFVIVSLFFGSALCASIPQAKEQDLAVDYASNSSSVYFERDVLNFDDYGPEYEYHQNGTLVARNPGRLVKLAADAIKKGFRAIQDGLKQDKNLRSDYTYRLIQELRSKYPQFNYVVCHTKHSYQWDGVKGVDWDHRHEEVDVKIGGTIGYEIYNARSGTFTRQGDGGFLNWAWGGNAVKVEDGGKRLVFAAP
ncbi:hypothetical protein ONZ45_g330 [Pleurotus djamor]|nr:hypothetical protein ONZ45_g330 [Pleurotus djamor]